MYKKIIFAGGCFWCTETVFKMIKGVINVVSGYASSEEDVKDIPPTYAEVSTGETDYIESVLIEYDSDMISLDDLLTVFFFTHDPTTINRQGNDVGPQYRSAIFYFEEEQENKILDFIKVLNSSDEFKSADKTVVTEVKPYKKFYKAEDYHQDYFDKNKNFNPYCQIVIAPKIDKLEKRFKELLK